VKPFPRVVVVSGGHGVRSERVFKGATWASNLQGELFVYSGPIDDWDGAPTDDPNEIGRFSAGSGWCVFAEGEDGQPFDPSAPATVAPPVVDERP
jgi:hypothetical protein